MNPRLTELLDCTNGKQVELRGSKTSKENHPVGMLVAAGERTRLPSCFLGCEAQPTQHLDRMEGHGLRPRLRSEGSRRRLPSCSTACRTGLSKGALARSWFGRRAVDRGRRPFVMFSTQVPVPFRDRSAVPVGRLSFARDRLLMVLLRGDIG